MLIGHLPDAVGLHGVGLPSWSGNLAVLLAKATIILVAAVAITRQMHRASAGARHLVWLVTLGTLLFVPALTAWAPLALRILPPRTVATDVAVPVAVPGAAPVVGSTTASDRAEPPAASTTTAPATVPAAPATIASPAPAVSWVRRAIDAGSFIGELGFALWAGIALIIAAALGWSALAVRHIVRRGSPLDDPAWQTPLLEVSDRLGLTTPPRLLVSTDIKMPFACGVLSPTIVLPAECDAWSPARRNSVLLHELAHVRRGDLMGHMLGRLVCALYWFHPLVWMAAKRLRSESERACDDLALACGTRATDYAEHLLDIVTSVRATATPAVALAMARRKEFEGRLLAILDPDLRHSTPSRRQSAALITALALSASLIAAAAPAPRAPAPRAADASPRQVASDRSTSPIAQPAAQAPLPDAPRRGASAAAAMAATAAPAPLSPAQHEATLGGSLRGSLPSRDTIPVDQSNTSVAATPEIVFDVAVSDGSPPEHSQNPGERAELLAKVLRTDSSGRLRRIAAWGLHDFSESSVATDALVNAVAHDADERVREMAAWALSSYEHDAPVAAALGAALQHDRSEDVRTTAAWALGDRGTSASADALVAALTDSSTRVRERAAWALGNVQPRQAPASLVAMLHDPDEQARSSAAWALYEIHDPASLPGIEAALRAAPDEDTQIMCLRAMAAMGDQALDAIRGLLESSNPRIKAMAVRVLAGGRATGPWPRPRPEPRPFP
jgi:beta-lactamase regulating signal transducer with metallopeptidase domain